MVGLVGKSNDKGLGILTEAYVKHLPIDRLLCVLDSISDRRYKKARYVPQITPGVAQEFLRGLDTVIMLETPHEHILRLSGPVRTIVKVNYEFFPKNHSPIDIALCSSSLNYDALEGDERVGERVLIPDPVDTTRIPFRQRTRAKTFVHNGGTLGVGGANGTEEFLKAIPMVESDAKFIIRSQVPIGVPDDPRIEHHVGSVPFEELYEDGDVFVLPQKFRATSLPIQEAMAAGMPVMTTDIQPFNEFCQILFEPERIEKLELARPVRSAVLSPKKIAESIDYWYNRDISELSTQAHEFAQTISWDALQQKYERIIRSK